MRIAKLIVRPHIDYIMLMVNFGLTSCEDLAMALLFYNVATDIISVVLVSVDEDIESIPSVLKNVICSYYG